jgi:succinate dehydrogenase/fumarate reductase flavoprotein subunit
MLHTLYGAAMKHDCKFFVEYLALDLIMDTVGGWNGCGIMGGVVQYGGWQRSGPGRFGR